MSGVKLAPSILTADFGALAEQIEAAEAGGADYFHLDVMDGHFVPPITFGPLVVEAVRKATKLPLDVHLMIEHPERQFDAFAEAGADIINFHIEASTHTRPPAAQHPRDAQTRGHLHQPGDAAERDRGSARCRGPGDGDDDQPRLGRAEDAIPRMLDKVRRLKALLDARGLSPDIEVDGGVKAGNTASCVEAGAHVLVCGSSVYNSDASPQANLRELRKAADSAQG